MTARPLNFPVISFRFQVSFLNRPGLKQIDAAASLLTDGGRTFQQIVQVCEYFFAFYFSTSY